MKKIITILFASILCVSTANAEIRMGISGAYTMFSSDGTETVKSSGTKNSKSHDDETIVPSLFVEKAGDNGFAVGLDFIPVGAELGSGSNARTDTDTDDASDTAGTNKISAELSSHTTLYVSKELNNILYVKGGLAYASIDTTESLATGTKYGNEDVFGLMIGAGVNRDLDNGAFFRTELTYTDYEDAKFQGSLDANSVRNTIDADVDALAIRVSIGKAF